MGLLNWHKRILANFQNRNKISNYQIVWISWLKGFTMGIILYHFLLM